jgi:hypothetical protein
MSAQGATIRQGRVHVPLSAVAGLIAVAVAVFVITSVVDGAEPRGRATAPIAAVANNPGMWTLSQAESYLDQLESLEVSNPGMWTLSEAEAYLDSLEVPTHPKGSAPTSGRRPPMVDGYICGQCR